MRPTVILSAAAALSVAALMTPAPSGGQDVPERRAYETLVQSLDGRTRVWRLGDDSTRAVLGISLAPARSRSDTVGVRVSDVADDGPAAKAGIEEGDRIVSIDGTTLRIDPADADDPMFRDLGSRRLERALAKHKPGDEVSLLVQRGHEVRTVRVKTVAASTLERNGGFALAPGVSIFRRDGNARAFIDSVRKHNEERAALGLAVGATGTKRDTLGLFVSNVASDGPAEKAGIVEGVRIASIDAVDLRVARDDADDWDVAQARARRFTRELEKHKAGDDISLRVWQNGAYRTVTLKAARASDVWKNRNGFSFSFGDGDGTFVMPPMAPMAPMAPMPPMAPLAPATPMIRMLPRTWMSAPLLPTTPTLRRVTALRSGTLRASALRASTIAPRFRTMDPRAMTVPRVRRLITY